MQMLSILMNRIINFESESSSATSQTNPPNSKDVIADNTLNKISMSSIFPLHGFLYVTLAIRAF
jgi:hypothetical protein